MSGFLASGLVSFFFFSVFFLGEQISGSAGLLLASNPKTAMRRIFVLALLGSGILSLQSHFALLCKCFTEKEKLVQKGNPFENGFVFFLQIFEREINASV